MRRILFSGAAVLSTAVCLAQSPRPQAPTKSAPHHARSLELVVEAGLNIATTPTLVTAYSTLKSNQTHVGLGSGFLLKLIAAPDRRLTFGGRLAMNSLRVWKDGYVIYNNGQTELVTAKYASPLIQIGLQGHVSLPLSPKFGLQLSPYGGYGFALSEGLDQTTRAVTAVPVGHSSGWNAGFDLSARITVSPQLTFTLASGYQHSWMRFSGSNYVDPIAKGFNISHIPFNAGVAVAF